MILRFNLEIIFFYIRDLASDCRWLPEISSSKAVVPCLWLCVVILPWSTDLSQFRHKDTFPTLLFTQQELMVEVFGWQEAWCSDFSMCSHSLVHPLFLWGSLWTGLFGRAGVLFIISDFPYIAGQKQLSLKHCFTARTPFSSAKAIHNFCWILAWWQLYWDPLCQAGAFLSTNGHTQGE